MNLPYPFNKASEVKADAQGAISLVDVRGKSLALIPLATAFELSAKAEGYGYSDGHGFRNGGGLGSNFGSGYGSGFGYGESYGQGDGSGRGIIK